MDTLFEPHAFVVHNPWGLKTKYKTNGGRIAEGTFPLISTGFGFNETEGKVIVAHDYNGAPMTCDIIQHGGIEPTKPDLGYIWIDEIGPYPNTSATPNLFGDFKMLWDFGTVSIQYNLTGVDPQCINPDTDQYEHSCGMAFYEGDSCDGKLGDLLVNPKIDGNPWEGVTYYAVGSQAQGKNRVTYGYDMEASKDNLLVLYNYQGEPIACNLLESWYTTKAPYENHIHTTPDDLGKVIGYSILEVLLSLLFTVGFYFFFIQVVAITERRASEVKMLDEGPGM